MRGGLHEGRCESYPNALYMCAKLSKKKIKEQKLTSGKGVIP